MLRTALLDNNNNHNHMTEKDETINDNSTAKTTPLPPTMKAAVVTAFGLDDLTSNLSVQTDWPTPTLSDDDDNDNALIIRVLACALAPGDVRVMSGKTAYLQCPEGPPYVIGSDVSGIVVQVPSSASCRFQVGDYVVSRFDEPKPRGGVAEYAKVLLHLTEHCPDSISPITACGLPASAMAAKRITADFVRKGDRVLVIGASGAVGSCVLQYAKLQGARFLAAESTQTQQCLRLGADQVIDYRQQRWWQVPAFQQDKFNVVFDMVNGDNWTVGAQTGLAVEPNGTYVALLSGVQTEMTVRGPWDIVPLMFTMMGRILWSKWHPRLPRWVAPEALLLQEGDLHDLLQDVASDKLLPIVDPACPFNFDSDGVRQAVALQQSRHAHGKVVIKIGET